MQVNENEAAVAPASNPAVKYLDQLPSSLGVRAPTMRPPTMAERKKNFENLD